MQDRRESWIFALALLSAASTLVSIAAAQILFGMACLLWIAIRPRPLVLPSYVLPLCVFMLTTFLSLAMSPDPGVGGSPIHKFFLYPIGLLAANFVSNARRVRLTIQVLLTTAAAGAIFSLIQFAFKERRYLATKDLADDPMALDRVKGFMGHWMTFSGGQLLVWCAAIPIVVFIGRRWLVPLALVGFAILISFTRSAWAGAGAGVLAAAYWIPRKQLISILVPIAVAGLLASPFIYHRISLSAHGKFGPDYGRVALWKVGVEMVRDHPLFGVGPERIPVEFPLYYKESNLDQFYYGHMQNDFLQIAAERGLICFAAFLWFLAELYRSFWRFLKSSDDTLRLTALSAMSALTGFLVMGLAEYNFGDSEPLMLFLFIVSIPFGVDAMLKRQSAGLP